MTTSEPDFDTMAVEALMSTTELTTPDDVIWYDRVKRAIMEQLRLAWNARGEADMRELAEPVSAIVDAIRSLDR